MYRTLQCELGVNLIHNFKLSGLCSDPRKRKIQIGTQKAQSQVHEKGWA